MQFFCESLTSKSSQGTLCPPSGSFAREATPGLRLAQPSNTSDSYATEFRQRSAIVTHNWSLWKSTNPRQTNANRFQDFIDPGPIWRTNNESQVRGSNGLPTAPPDTLAIGVPANPTRSTMSPLPVQRSLPVRRITPLAPSSEPQSALESIPNHPEPNRAASPACRFVANLTESSL